MSCKVAIALRLPMSNKPGRPRAPRPPVAYGEYLGRIREQLGLSRPDLATRAGIDPNTVLRNEKGSEDRSVKGLVTMRDALLKYAAEIGREISISPVPTDENWSESPPARAQLTPTAEKFRRNLLRFREAAKLDVHSLAYMASISIETYRRYEDGDEEISVSALEALASALGCEPGDFFADPTSTPIPKLEPAREYWLGGPGTEHLSAEARTAIDRIMEPFVREVRERRDKAERDRNKPKRK